MSIPISMTVNGKQVSKSCPANRTLGQFIREDLGLTGTHVGCDTSQCGACTVHLNGDAVKACTVLAVQAEGAEVTTIEGIGTNKKEAGSTLEVSGNAEPDQTPLYVDECTVEYSNTDWVKTTIKATGYENIN